MEVFAKVYRHINMKNNNRFGDLPAVKIWNVVCRFMAPYDLVASYVSEESASPSSG
jgi:hypothetical protein